MSDLARGLLEYILPAACVLCGEDCGQGLLCNGCSTDLPRIRVCCHRCGLPARMPNEMGGARLCADCAVHPPDWDHAIAALIYQYPVDHLVRNFKFHKDLACGQLLAGELVQAVGEHLAEPAGAPARPDLLVPVPLHFWRSWRRGFNQAELLASELHKHSGIPLDCRLLRRTRATPAQSGLDRKARQRNIKGAFACGPLRALHVALIDDVLTTGVTLQECSKALRHAGASRVSVWVAARVPAPGH